MTPSWIGEALEKVVRKRGWAKMRGDWWKRSGGMGEERKSQKAKVENISRARPQACQSIYHPSTTCCKLIVYTLS